jgi:hypothetical protein
MIKLGIISLDDVINKPTNLDYLLLEKSINEYLQEMKFEKSLVTLVGNTFPYINHLATKLFLDKTNDYQGLILCTPSDYNIKANLFTNTYEGRVLNSSHEKFKNDYGIDSSANIKNINQIVKPLAKSAIVNIKIIIKRGFKQNETELITNCDHIIIFGKNTPDDITPCNNKLIEKIKSKKNIISVRYINY